jgi:RND family efflux transporter MFP subunit
MRPSDSNTAARLILALVIALACPSTVVAQGEDVAVPVSYTIARQHTLRPTVRLPGTVKSRHRSIIGSETEGIVVALHVREGDAILRGASLAQLRTDILEQRLNAARSQLDATRASREFTSRSLARARQLFDTNSTSEQQLDELATDLLGWQAEERRLAAEIAQIELSIDHSHIRAPFDGIIVARHTDIGEWREVGDPIVELLSVSDLEVDVAVPEIYFDELNTTESAEVAFPAISDQRFDLEISAVVPVADSEAHTFSVKLRLSDDPERPRVAVGMLAEVWLSIGGQASAATIVPKDAIVQRLEERLVVLINDDQQTRIEAVLTGNSVGAWIEVQGNVAPGDRVIVRGNERLGPEQSVEATLLDYQVP